MADPEVKPDGPALSPREEPAGVGPEPAPHGWEGVGFLAVLVLFGVLGPLISMLLPAVQAAREASRRRWCMNNLGQIGQAIHNYSQAQKILPPGTVCSSTPTPPGSQYDVLREAAQGEPGNCGAGLLLRILPYIEGDTIFPNWNWGVGISNSTTSIAPYAPNCNLNLAMTDIPSFYCPSRRSGLRSEDHAMMLSPAWTGGGTDYGGCAGRHAAFSKTTGYNICDATMYYEPNFRPTLNYPHSPPATIKVDEVEAKRWGIFGRVNVGTRFDEIIDGTSNTIMIGELQRITDLTPGSKDGWAIGGPASLFTTGAMARRNGSTFEFVASAAEGRLMNNDFWGSPGGPHPGGVNFGMGDGSWTFINESIDPSVFALLGSMADGLPVQLPQ
jgi:prepilin-type processing-associated H-X9-DG protein